MGNIIQSVKGTQDFYPEEMARRNWLYNNIRKVSESFGYQEWEGPIIESLELYAAKSGEELVKEQAFVFEDKGGSLITLRPELTPTLARMVAQKQNELVFPLRWWSYGPMWRYERPQKGRTREFFQWNIDLVGANSPEADAELVSIAAKFLMSVGLNESEVVILVNNRKLMDAELTAMGILKEDRSNVFRLIDRRDKMDAATWQEYVLKSGVSDEQFTALVNILEDKDLWKKSEDLVRFFDTLNALGVKNFVQFAPNIIRGLDYYTGTVFECYDRERKFRAILAGGRYDNLVADVGGQPLSAVGFAMGDKVIQVVLEHYEKLPDTQSLTESPILVTVFSQDTIQHTYDIAKQLRDAGLKVATYPEGAKLAKQFKYADRIKAPIVLVIGPDEINDEMVNIKFLKDGTQQLVSKNEVARTIIQLLDSTKA